MGDKNSDNSSISNETLLMVLSGFIGYLLVKRIYSNLLKWNGDPFHRTLLFVTLSLAFAAVVFILNGLRIRMIERRSKAAAVTGPAENAVYCGVAEKNEEIFIKTKQRSMHTQVIGTTNAGKTESVILPWAIQDIEQGRGLVLIDGQAYRTLLEKLWAYTVKNGREADFRLFSLGSIDESHQFNPLIGGSPEEIAERVFNSFEFENEYFRSVQFEVFSQVMRIFADAEEIPTFLKLHQAITDPSRLVRLSRRGKDESLIQWASYYHGLMPNDRTQRTSGLTAAISQFAFGKTSTLFNSESPSISLESALNENHIVYFQLPVLLAPFLGKASGKMILQCLQSAVANRHRSDNRSPNFFSVFLDDFSEYLYPGFVSVLNKSRSANVGIVFAHQALGDIKTLGDAIANTILTNANLKVFMRGNDPDSAEYFAKVVGTKKGEKYTSRTKKAFFANQSTGDGSIREVEEFIMHPNKFKNELGVGEAVMVIPHDTGSRAVLLKFRKYEDIISEKLFEKVPKILSPGLPVTSGEAPVNRVSR